MFSISSFGYFKNISLNNFENKICIFQLGLTDRKNIFLMLKEDKDSLGDQHISLGRDFDFENKKFISRKISINYFQTQYLIYFRTKLWKFQIILN